MADESWICAGCGYSQSMETMAWSYYGSFYCGEKCIKNHRGRI